MQYFMLLVLHQVELLDELVAAWEKAGVTGVTIMASTGLGRIFEKALLREDIPLIPSLNDLLGEEHEEITNRTVFSMVSGDEIVDRVVKATESVLGDLSRPRTGILAVIPMARVYGLRESQDWKNENSRH